MEWKCKHYWMRQVKMLDDSILTRREKRLGRPSGMHKQTREAVVQEDKWKHLTASFMIASVSSVPYQITGKNEYMLGAVGIALLAGLAKEYHDATVPGWHGVGLEGCRCRPRRYRDIGWTAISRQGDAMTVRVNMSRNAGLEEFFRSLALKVLASLTATLVIWAMKMILNFVG